MADITTAQQAAMQAFLDAVRPLGGGQHGIEVEVVLNFARDEPEVAAVAVQAMLQVAAESKGYGMLAVALADAYESAFGDDTLSVIVREHYAALGQPVPELRFQEDLPPEPTRPVRYEVSEDELEQCDIYPLLKGFSHRHLDDGDSVARLAGLGGRVILTFPIPAADPRAVWEVPSVRAYVRALADAMPYFPFYLLTDPRFGMFEVYFGSLVDPEQLEAGTFDLLQKENFVVVAPALLATMQFADGLGADGEASVRALLAVFPTEVVDYTQNSLREIQQEIEQERRASD
jgi:hypothetical protein